MSTESAAPIPTGALEHLDPSTLTLELNVRTEAALTKQFIASIKENGVLVPITAVRDAEGNVHVRAGQRRTLAAREAGLATVPVYVTDASDDTATRLVQQMTENDQRLSMTSEDRVKGIQQLLDTGLSITKVAKRLAVAPERVKQSKAAAGSEVAMDALRTHSVSLVEAAVIAEFDDDPDAVERLTRAAGRSYFEQEAERLRQVREEARLLEEAQQRYAELGYTVLHELPSDYVQYVPLRGLRDAEGNTVDESVVVDPKHWAVVLTEDSVFIDGNGNQVDETLIDWSTEDDPDKEPAEGMVHANTVNESFDFVVQSYYCIDPTAAGLTVLEQNLRSMGTPLVDPAKVDAQREIESAERRKVIALNKAAMAAETVRRKFVTEMLKRKTPPDGAAQFVARQLSHDGALLNNYHADEVERELLGGAAGDLLDGVTENRAQVLTLGMTLAALEALTPKSAWRGQSRHSQSYLRFLAQQGYGLSPVEQVMVGDLSADECMKELA